jgi:hypothetical protein
MRKAFVGLLVLPLLLAACQTEPATNVTQSSATLNGRGNCENGLHLWWWYELRQEGGGWTTPPQQAQRLDCNQHTNEGAIPSLGVSGLPSGTNFDFRIAYQQDGQPVGVCDKNGGCAQKGTAQEGNLAYDGFTTDHNEAGNGGSVYEAGTAIPAASAEKHMTWRHRTHYGTGLVDYTWSEIEAKRITAVHSIYATCKIRVRVVNVVNEATNHGEQGCKVRDINDAWNGCARKSLCAGGRADFWLRLNNANKRWTQTFTNRPNRGCELAYTAQNQHVLHCTNFQGTPYSAAIG